MLTVFLIYGLPFFLLWVVIFVYPKRISRFSLPRNMSLMALFAMFHGIHEWTEMFTLINRQDLLPLQIVKLITLPVSFYFLLAFAFSCCFRPRNRFFQLVPALLFLIWTAATASSSQLFTAGDIYARYILGVPGIVLTSYALMLQTSEIALLNTLGLIQHLGLTAGAFLFYAFFSGLVVPDAGFFPASVLNYSNFSRTVGIPVQIFRGLCIILITYGLVRVLRMFEWHAIDSIQKAHEAKIAQLAPLSRAPMTLS